MIELDVVEKSKAVFCLCCEKELKIDEFNCIYGGGVMKLSFGYGSLHDQSDHELAEDYAQSMEGSKGVLGWKRILLGDEIEAYLCDNCFDEKKHLIRGFEVTTETKRREIKV